MSALEQSGCRPVETGTRICANAVKGIGSEAGTFGGFRDVRYSPRADSRGSGTSALQRQRSQSSGAGLVIAAAVDPAVAECAARSRVVESVESTSLCDADFDSCKASKNLFGNEPSLSAQGTGGICGS
jgi:hypothetical protein